MSPSRSHTEVESYKKNLLHALVALNKGDFSVRLKGNPEGIDGKIIDAFNAVVENNAKMVRTLELTSRMVGKEGKISQRIAIGEMQGAWAGSVEAVNTLIDDLVAPTTEMARVIGAVSAGDLSQTMDLEIDGRKLKGEFLRTAKTVNTMVSRLGSFASEVTRVAREVGTEGQLGGQAVVRGVAGTWKDLTDNVNSMASNLTNQVRNIAEVTKAVANGDLSKKITADARGEIQELKNTINTMVDQLNSFASEVTRVAREVGSEGKLGGQAIVRGVAGTWKDLTDNVNSMGGNLTNQVRNIAEVTKAVATGDLSKKITADARGEIQELKNTINTMVDQLNSFASEVTRVAREVGTEGKLGGQAEVRGVGGTWKDLTDNVNSMASNLTNQVRNIAQVTTAVANGDLSKKITVDVQGEMLEMKNTINTMVDQLNSFASEVTRVAREVGTEGKLGGQAEVRGVAGTWKDLTDNVNSMASNLTNQVRNIAQVTTAVANGDLSKKITASARGEIQELKNTINTMVDQLNSFASEVTRVAREVGSEGKLGGQAEVKGVSGTWKNLTDNVNMMAANLTGQVRGIAKVVTSVANGDLKQKLAFEAKGEIAALADTINGMIDTLAIFAVQVTTVAREVGVEGKLGGQASVPGTSGTWKVLVDNVNQLAANLTTQVRAIAEVATAVTKGDLTRSIQVGAQGEVEALKDNINQMIANLRETTLKNAEQDWLKTNLAKFTQMLQGKKDLLTVSRQILAELAPVVSAQQGVFYLMTHSGDQPKLRLLASYAHRDREGAVTEFALGESLIGQCALEKERILLTNVPPDYIQINSGLGESPPLSIIVLPVVFENAVKGVIELASFEKFNATHLAFLEQLTESIGIVLNTIEANTRTEDLLTQSQSLAQELQSQQEELRNTNEELEDKATLLVRQNEEVERKNREVENAKLALEEKATQLALTSKYKSEFLANMSHELRTPLNSLLILAHQLSQNTGGNLDDKQVRIAGSIYSAGTDLLTLINDILDLSKIESGTVTLDASEFSLVELSHDMDRTFRHMADSKGLEFSIEVESNTPPYIVTDSKRLQQVLKNLISNAFKFTEKGKVNLRIFTAEKGWTPGHPFLDGKTRVLGFAVSDTGIGISPDKQQLIFEAFQQADGTTSRKYGGTGLGLSISREISRLLCGEISLHSEEGTGSIFTLYLPCELEYINFPVSEASQAESYRAFVEKSDEVMWAGAGKQPKMDIDPALEDDRLTILPGDKILLIIEDDAIFARLLLEIAHEKGFKAVVAGMGRRMWELIRQYSPLAITLDMHLPDIDGWRLLERLKQEPETRHLPVLIISVEEDRIRGLSQGAMDFLTKPVSKEKLENSLDFLNSFLSRDSRRILVIEPREIEHETALQLVDEAFVETQIVRTLDEAVEKVSESAFDCAVLQLESTNGSAAVILEELRKRPILRNLPIVVRLDTELPGDVELRLRELSKSMVIRQTRSQERLLDEVLRFLHVPQQELSDSRQKVVDSLHGSDEVFVGKKILLVDDDIRNIFAMTSYLENYGMEVISAENGSQGLEMLEKTPDMDVILMDIMMPGMDGYETTRAIRKNPKHADVPILAITAKAMQGDREKCLSASASDYIAKPFDPVQLLTMLRQWLYR